MSEPDHRGGLPRAAAGPGPGRVAAVLLAVAGLLVLASLASRYLAYRADSATPGSAGAEAWITLMRLFDVNSETNVPTWFASGLLLAAAVTAGSVGAMVRRAGGRDGRHWLALAGILAVLSLDEAAALHERLGGPAEALFGDAAGRFAWVVPGAALVAVGAVLFLRFVRRLPSRIRRHVLGGGAVFVSGAVMVEAVSGAVLATHGDRAAYLLVTAAEEGLEMAGSVWLLYAALRCVTVTTDRAGGWRLTPPRDLLGTARPAAGMAVGRRAVTSGSRR